MSGDINLVLPVVPRPVTPGDGVKQPRQSGGQSSFREAVRKEIAREQGVRLSAHAERRLRERNITLAQNDLERIGAALKEADSKGARESLIIYDGLALITNVRSKTIVTAMDGGTAGYQVFTNIDSAVIVG